MDERQTKLCQKVLEELARRPIAKMFWTPGSPAIMGARLAPLSFSFVAERLHRGLYRFAEEWIADMRTLFTNSMKQTKTAVRAAAAYQLSVEFEHLLLNHNPAFANCVVKLELEELNLADFIEKNKVFRPKIMLANRDPGAEIFHENDVPITREKIAEEVGQLFSSDLLLRVVAFIGEIQPEVLFLNDDDVRVLFALLTDENVKKVHHFVMDLLNLAVRGEIEPFGYGSVMEKQVTETDIV
jgi:hypothetical protein